MSRDDYAELAARIERLERKLDGKGPGGAGLDGAAAVDQLVAAVPDGPERFWLLDQLRRRSGGSGLVYGGLAELRAGPVAWQRGHDPGALLEVDWVELAPRIAALGHPVRLRILQLVLRGTATTAAELAGTEGIGTTGQVYHHLRQLSAAGWLQTGSRGVHEVPVERVIPLLIILAAAG